jgi:hypothetical protein
MAAKQQQTRLVQYPGKCILPFWRDHWPYRWSNAESDNVLVVRSRATR